MRVYAVLGAPPEVQAYGLAKYSRSAQPLDASINELSTQRAEQFLNTFYFQYGHRSIADLAHVTLAIEDISLLAAFYLVDEPLWDGQGRSSRFQDFRKNGFYIPSQLQGTAEHEAYLQALDQLLSQYEYFSAEVLTILTEVVPRPEEMTPAAYTRTLRARAFDIARYLLPLATKTSNGQITSARVLEGQISRLSGHALTELQELASAIRQACQTPAYNLIEQKLSAAWEAARLSPEQIELVRNTLEAAGVLGVSAAPTLVKYTTADVFGPQTLARMRQLLAPHLREMKEDPDLSSSVTIMEPEADLLDACVSTLLYLADTKGYAFHQLHQLAHSLPEDRKRELFALSLACRGEHDDWLRLHRLGYLLGFELLMDFGSLRDLHRHRRCVQIIPDLKLNLGFDDPARIFEGGLGPSGAELAARRGLIEQFGAALQQAIATAMAFPHPEHALYLLPLGARQRALFKMDVAEAAYLIEQRAASGGHFSYRRVAYQMHRELCQRHPYLAAAIRIPDPNEAIDLLKR